MKLITYRYQGQTQVGVVAGCETYAVPVSALGLSYADMNELIENITPQELAALRKASARSCDDCGSSEGVQLDQVELMAPIPVPKQEVICVGVNYMEHAYESAKYKKEEFHGDRPFPVYFCKRCNLATPDGGYIDGHFNIQERLDYESELAVIIGRDAVNVSQEDAWDYVFGYTIINDVTSRDLQQRHKQFYFGKSLDTFTCMGPWIVLKDDLPVPPAQHIWCKVNGELRQESNTDRMIFDIPYLISELSGGMCLKAGTIISTGTPSGVGMGFDPPRWLSSGDVVECGVDGIGVLTNIVK